MLNDLTKRLLIALGSFLAGVGTSLLSDFSPIVFPALLQTPPKLLLKTILFLVIAFLMVSVFIVYLWLKSRPHEPNSEKGIFHKIPWIAEITYNGNEIRTRIDFICPVHSTPLGHQQMTPTQHQGLFCYKCQAFQNPIHNKHVIYQEEAWQLVRNQILSRIRA